MSYQPPVFGKLEEIDKDSKKIKVANKWFECNATGFDYLDYYKLGDEVQITLHEGKVGMIAKVNTPKRDTSRENTTSTDSPTPKKKYVGVTVGMCMNNATHLCIAQKEHSAQAVIKKTKELLEEMEKHNLV